MNSRVMEKICDHLDLNSRIELGLKPRKIPPEVISNLEPKFPRPEIVYLSESKLLINFHFKYFGHVLSRPVDLDWIPTDPDEVAIFNMHCKEYITELICDCGQCMVLVRDQPWITELNVKVI
jgi:hypothetical protein